MSDVGETVIKGSPEVFDPDGTFSPVAATQPVIATIPKRTSRRDSERMSNSETRSIACASDRMSRKSNSSVTRPRIDTRIFGWLVSRYYWPQVLKWDRWTDLYYRTV